MLGRASATRWLRCAGTKLSRLFAATTNSIDAILSSNPMTSPLSIDSELQLPALGVGIAQPVRRRIIVVAIERIAAVGVAGLEAGVEIARQASARARSASEPAQAQTSARAAGRHWPRRRHRPRPRRGHETAASRRGGRDASTRPRHFRRTVGRANIEPARQHFRGVAAGAASEFENASARRKQREERRQPRLTRGDLAPGIGLGIAAVELQRLLVHRGTSHYGNSAICSSPAVSGSPNIRFMFWIACPAEPFTRLSSVEITMARFLMRSATTPICT